MNGYELRSEIISSGTKYYIQSNLVPGQGVVVTCLFLEGELLSKQSEAYDTEAPREELRGIVRTIHDERRARITSLIEIREKLRKDVDGRAHLKLGEALYRQKMYKEAMAEVIRSIKLGHEDSRGYSILGNCLLAQDDCEKAQRAFEKGIEIAPNYPDLHNDMGLAYLALDRCREAVASFEKALDLNKYYQLALLNLAIALASNVVKKQDYELSRNLQSRLRELLERNIQLRPTLDTAEFRDAIAAVENERYEVVHQKLTSIRDELDHIAQSDLSLELYLILKFKDTGPTEADVDGYLDRVRAALEANPNYADLHSDLGVLYTAKCKILIDEATKCFAEALKLNPGFAKAEKNLKLASNDRQGIHFLLRALLD